MKKQEQIKKIIQQLLETNNIRDFGKLDFNVAISRALLVNDDRTFQRWRNFLLHLGYVIQTDYEIYSINLEEIAKLEVEIDPEQRRLFNV